MFPQHLGGPPDSSPRRTSSELYGPDYYRTACGAIPYERNSHWLSFFDGLAEKVTRTLRPKRVFDAGCAWGFLVEALRDRGVDARGVDISDYAIGQVRPDVRQYCRVASLADPIDGGPYDLVTCIEVLEHMPNSEARQAVRNMTATTDAVLFSSTPDNFDEPTHVNIRPVIDWLRIFSDLGFYPDVVFDASFIAPHAFLVCRQAEPLLEDVLVLFAETLRYRSDRAVFLERQTLVEHLQAESSELRERVKQYEANLSASQGGVENYKSLAERLENELTALRGLLKSLTNQCEEHDLAREAEQVSAELENRCETLQMQRDRAEVTVNELIAHCAELSRSLQTISGRHDALQAELHSSPGWHLMTRYRRWLDFNRAQRPRLTRLWENAARWVFNSIKVASGGMKSEVPVPVTLRTESTVVQTPQTPKPSDEHDPVRLVFPSLDDYHRWIQENEPDAAQLEIQQSISQHFSYRPKVSVIVPVYRVPINVLKAMVESVKEQTYDNWELCVTVTRSENPQGTAYLEYQASRDSRIRVRVLDVNEGISRNSNCALDLATGEFVALLDHDDILAPFALFEIVQLLNQDASTNFIYSDKDEITEDGSCRLGPLFKPTWSPEVMLNANYLTHLCVMRTEHVREVGGWRPETDGAQDWDLFLRVIRRYGNVRHIPKILYHWRRLATSVAAGGLEVKPYALQAQVHSVQTYCDAIGLNAAVHHQNGVLRIRWGSEPTDRVSIVVLSGNPTGDTLRRAALLRERTTTKDLEILAPAPVGGAEAVPGVQLVEVAADATLAHQMALTARAASHKTLLFFDEHLEPADPDWLDEMTGPLQIAGVGIVGARLVDAKTSLLRHCGLTFSRIGEVEYVHVGQPEHLYERIGGTFWYRNWTAVSGACFAIRREVWEVIDAFSGDLLHSRLDIHVCLKLLQQTGLRVLYNPYARFLQSQIAAIEVPTQDNRKSDAARIRARLPNSDPYLNPNVECSAGRLFYRLHSGSENTGTLDPSATSQSIQRTASSSSPIQLSPPKDPSVSA